MTYALRATVEQGLLQESSASNAAGVNERAAPLRGRWEAASGTGLGKEQPADPFGGLPMHVLGDV